MQALSELPTLETWDRLDSIGRMTQSWRVSARVVVVSSWWHLTHWRVFRRGVSLISVGWQGIELEGGHPIALGSCSTKSLQWWWMLADDLESSKGELEAVCLAEWGKQSLHGRCDLSRTAICSFWPSGPCRLPWQTPYMSPTNSDCRWLCCIAPNMGCYQSSGGSSTGSEGTVWHRPASICPLWSHVGLGGKVGQRNISRVSELYRGDDARHHSSKSCTSTCRTVQGLIHQNSWLSCIGKPQLLQSHPTGLEWDSPRATSGRFCMQAWVYRTYRDAWCYLDCVQSVPSCMKSIRSGSTEIPAPTNASLGIFFLDWSPHLLGLGLQSIDWQRCRSDSGSDRPSPRVLRDQCPHQPVPNDHRFGRNLDQHWRSLTVRTQCPPHLHPEILVWWIDSGRGIGSMISRPFPPWIQDWVCALTNYRLSRLTLVSGASL